MRTHFETNTPILRSADSTSLRELEQTLKYKNPGEGWSDFEKKLRHLLGDAIRLSRRRDERDESTLASRQHRLDKRLAELIATD